MNIYNKLKTNNMNIRKLIRETLEKGFDINLIKESINVGDTVTNNGNFYKVIGSFTGTDVGNSTSDIDDRSFYTALKVKNLETGIESSGKYSYFKKINPEEIEDLKQAKLAQDAADKTKKEKDKVERDARWAKHSAEMAEKERERTSSKGDTELVKKMISDWENNMIEIDYSVESHEELVVNCILNLDDDDIYDVEFVIKYKISKSRYSGYTEPKFTLDMVNITKDNNLLYKGRAEFLGLFDNVIEPWVQNNEELLEKTEEIYISWASSY